MAASVIYIHGFLSSPQSRKCQISKQWFNQHFPDTTFCAPHLSSYPDQAEYALCEYVSALGEQKKYAIGSSLGGFWATYLVESGLIDKAVLVNPGVLPHTRFREFIGRNLKSYYTEESFTLTETDVENLARFDFSTITDVDKYWLMVQTGDDVLDYRLAVDKYAGCKQLVEDGGSHAFDGFDSHLQSIADFFDLT